MRCCEDYVRHGSDVYLTHNCLFPVLYSSQIKSLSFTGAGGSKLTLI
jgi:hypothetical protein